MRAPVDYTRTLCFHLRLHAIGRCTLHEIPIKFIKYAQSSGSTWGNQISRKINLIFFSDFKKNKMFYRFVGGTTMTDFDFKHHKLWCLNHSPLKHLGKHYFFPFHTAKVFIIYIIRIFFRFTNTFLQSVSLKIINIKGIFPLLTKGKNLK